MDEVHFSEKSFYYIFKLVKYIIMNFANILLPISYIPTMCKCVELNYMSHEKNPGCLGYVGDYTIQLYINNYKDPNKPTSIMESDKGFFRGSYIFIDSIHGLPVFRISDPGSCPDFIIAATGAMFEIRKVRISGLLFCFFCIA